jgi:hypothetical protein
MTEPIYLVAGARPNFIKLAPLVWVLHSRPSMPFQIIHTGQHYDRARPPASWNALTDCWMKNPPAQSLFLAT